MFWRCHRKWMMVWATFGAWMQARALYLQFPKRHTCGQRPWFLMWSSCGMTKTNAGPSTKKVIISWEGACEGVWIRNCIFFAAKTFWIRRPFCIIISLLLSTARDNRSAALKTCSNRQSGSWEQSASHNKACGCFFWRKAVQPRGRKIQGWQTSQAGRFDRSGWVEGEEQVRPAGAATSLEGAVRLQQLRISSKMPQPSSLLLDPCQMALHVIAFSTLGMWLFIRLLHVLAFLNG